MRLDLFLVDKAYAESRQKALDRMVKLEAPDKLPDHVRMRFDSGSESGQDVLKLDKL